jgi:FixJ family two-component response regulator
VAAIVDDDTGICSALGLLLTTFQWESQAYSSAEEFLDAYSPGSAECLIADLNLPGISGVDLLRELASRKSALPSIIMTGQADPVLISKAKEIGALAVLSKPFKSTELLPLLEQALKSCQPTK